MLNKISSFDLRDNLSNFIDSVVKTESSYIVQRYGKPVALLIPYKESFKPDYQTFFGFLGGKKSGEEFVSMVRRTKKEFDRVKQLRNS